MAFEKYVGSARDYISTISITKDGRLRLNAGVMGEYNVNDFDYVVLFYDAEAKRIGLKLSRDASEIGCRKLTLNKTSKTKMVNALGMFKTFGIDFSCTRRYPVFYEQEMLVINLTDEVRI